MNRLIAAMFDPPDKGYALLMMFVAAFFGFLKLFREERHLVRRHRFSVEFLDDLNRYIESAGDDKETYSMLVKRADRMQKEYCMPGVSGRGSSAKEKHFGHCPMIINRLTELRTSLSYSSMTRTRMPDQYGVALIDMLTAHIGIVEDRKAEQVAMLWNPLVWLREGIGLILALPVSILHWVGLISRETVDAAREKPSFRKLKGVATILVVGSAVAVLAVGWPEYKGWLRWAALQGKYAVASLKRLL